MMISKMIKCCRMMFAKIGGRKRCCRAFLPMFLIKFTRELNIEFQASSVIWFFTGNDFTSPFPKGDKQKPSKLVRKNTIYR